MSGKDKFYLAILPFIYFFWMAMMMMVVMLTMEKGNGPEKVVNLPWVVYFVLLTLLQLGPPAFAFWKNWKSKKVRMYCLVFLLLAYFYGMFSTVFYEGLQEVWRSTQ